MVDRNMEALSRIWCLWEVFLASYRKGETCVRLVSVLGQYVDVADSTPEV